MSARKPYVHPVQGWWQRNPYYVKYMAMELTSVIVGIYGVLLLVGLWRLSQGESQYEVWRASIGSPVSIALQFFMLIAMIYHAYTWWKVLPKTMPLLHMNGKPVPGVLLSSAGWLASVAASLIVFVIVRGGT